MRVPCWGRSTVRDFTGGIRTRFFHWCEVSEIFTTSVCWAATCGQPDNKTNSFAARERMRRCCEPLGVRSVIGIRLAPSFPPTGPALLGTRLSGVSPGIRVSRSGFKPVNFKRIALRKIKNPPERLAREGPWSGLSISLRRDRSHEPCIRHRSAQSRSSVGRVCRIRGSSQGSCWFANPMFARAREIRPRVVVVKRQVELCCNRWRDHPTHVTRVTTLAISSARHAWQRHC